MPSATTVRPIAFDDQPLNADDLVPVQIDIPSIPDTPTIVSEAASRPPSEPGQMDEILDKPSYSAWNTDLIRLNTLENSATVSSGCARKTKCCAADATPKCSSKDIFAVPQVETKQRRHPNPKKGKIAVITVSPYKLEFQTRIDEADKKKRGQEGRAEKKLKYRTSQEKNETLKQKRSTKKTISDRH